MTKDFRRIRKFIHLSSCEMQIWLQSQGCFTALLFPNPIENLLEFLKIINKHGT